MLGLLPRTLLDGISTPLPQETVTLSPTISATRESLETTQSSPGAYPGPETTPRPVTITPNLPIPSPGIQDGLITDVPEQAQQTELVVTVDFNDPIPTAVPTPGFVETQIRATDPRDFSITSGEIQLVEFFAFWSPISVSMAPPMNYLEKKYKDQINFIYLDIDDPANSLFTALLGDRLPPVFFLLDGDGVILSELRGRVTVEEFESLFDSVLISP